MDTNLFLQRLAEHTEDPRTASLLFLALRGGNCAKTDLQAFLKLKGRVDRFDAYLNDLRDPISGNAVAQNGPGERIHLLPAADWKLIRRRQFHKEQAPEFTFEAGLAEARAEVEAFAPSPRPSPPMGARETTSGGGSPPVAAGPVASVVGWVRPEQLKPTETTEMIHMEAARIRGELATMIRLEGGKRWENWRRWHQWWESVERCNPGRILVAWRLFQETPGVQKPENFMATRMREIRQQPERGLREEQIETLRLAYPRRSHWQEGTEAIRAALERFEFDEILQGTLKIAAFIKTLPGGANGPYIPCLPSFFRGARWKDDPATWDRRKHPDGPTARQRPETIQARTL